LGEFCLYLLLAVLSTWPLARDLDRSVALGQETAASVPLFTTWTVWWNADRMAHGYRGYWDAPIFHPDADTFAFSEPMPTTAIVAPLLWLSHNRLLAHNVFLLAALALNGWAGLQLLRDVGLGRWSATLGGTLIVLMPMVHRELGVLQLVPLFGILWTVRCLLRFEKRPSPLRGVWLGAAFAVTYLTCASYGLFLSVLLPLGAVWILGKRWRDARTWTTLPIAVLASLALVAPVVVLQWRAAHQHGLVRSPELVKRLSAKPEDYLISPGKRAGQPAAIGQRRAETRFLLYPGIVIVGLALLGTWGGLVRQRHRRWTAFCVTVLLAAFMLSLGPGFRLASWSPYAALMDWYPGFAQVRSPFRFAIFVQLMTVLLAACGLSVMERAVQLVCARGFRRGSDPLRWHRGGTILACVCTLAVAGAALTEILPPRPAMYTPPTFPTQRGWIEWLQTNTLPDSIVVCLPFPQGDGVRDYEQTTLWMYWATFHQRKLVNGYSGFLPANYVATKQQMIHFPDAASIRQLQSHAATYCVIHRSYRTRKDLESDLTARRYLCWCYADERAEIDIYRLRTPDAKTAQPEAFTLKPPFEKAAS